MSGERDVADVFRVVRHDATLPGNGLALRKGAASWLGVAFRPPRAA
jgi:hypothetical protein